MINYILKTSKQNKIQQILHFKKQGNFKMLIFFKKFHIETPKKFFKII